MTLSYHVTGAERKNLVGVLSSILNEPTNYLVAPSFTYEVGGYTIDKAGTVTGPDDLGLVDALRQAGFNADSGDAHGEEVTRNIPDALTIEMPMAGFTPDAIDRLCKMVTAKEPLLKAALGTDDLPISVFEDRLTFPWFCDADADHAEAYATLVSLLCKTAKEKQRVNAKEKAAPDNPKYAFRCFLLSLGMIGDEYKKARKILLSRLEGSSAFKNGRKAEVTISE